MTLPYTIGLFTKPDRTWKNVREQKPTLPKIMLTHVLILALIPAASAYYGTTQIGWRIGDSDIIRLTEESGLQLCALFYFAMVMGIVVLGKFIDYFSITYNESTDKDNVYGVALAAYAATPLFIAGAAALQPTLWVAIIASLLAISYAVYLLYEGTPILMDIPEEKGFLFATSVLTVALVMLVALMATTVVIWSAGIGPVYTS